MENNIKSSDQILDEAVRRYNPSTVIMLTSGGHDSMVAMRYSSVWKLKYDFDYKIISLDTGLSSDGWKSWLITTMSDLGHLGYFDIWDNKDVGFNWYAQNALEYGFGYTEYFHTTFYYRMLKERTIKKILRYYKKHRRDHVMFISGVYRAESIKRANVPECQKIGSSIWVNPLCHWSKLDIEQYRLEYNIPINPFYETTGGSGDCNCNWGQFITLNDLTIHSPILAGKITQLNNQVRDRHGYGWGEKPSKGLISERKGQLVLPGIKPLCTPNLCNGCSRPKQGMNNATDDYLTNNIEWKTNPLTDGE